MGRSKRKPANDGQQNSSSYKRPRVSYEDMIHQDNKKGMFAPKAPKDPFTNQEFAFPGLGDGDEEFAGPACDGLSYLKMVRSEARTVPAVLVPTPNIKIEVRDVAGLSYDDNDGNGSGELNYGDDAGEDIKVEPDDDAYGEEFWDEGDSNDQERGFWDDDQAFIAPRSPTPPKPLEISALEQWNTSALLPTFHRIRKLYHSSPPPSTASPYPTPIGVQDWHSISRDPTRPPTFAFLRSLKHDNLLRGLRYVADLLKAGRDCEIHYTQWIWALLIAVKNWEEIDEEGLVVIRNVGKKAAQVLERLRSAGELEDKPHDVNQASADAAAEVPQKRRPGRRNKDDKYDPYTPSANTLATLDMVVSVVGEVWRQRDLLQGRVTHSLGEKWNFEIVTRNWWEVAPGEEKELPAETVFSEQEEKGKHIAEGDSTIGVAEIISAEAEPTRAVEGRPNAARAEDDEAEEGEIEE